MDFLEWAKNKTKQLRGEDIGAKIPDRFFRQETERKWYNIVKEGLPPRYSNPNDVPEEVREEALRWLNSEEYNINPISFIKEFEQYAANRTYDGLDLVNPAYEIVANYTMAYYKIASIDHAHCN